MQMMLTWLALVHAVPPPALPVVSVLSSPAEVACTRDGQTVYSGGWDGTVKGWDAATGELLQTFWHGGMVVDVAVSADGRTVYSAGTDGFIKKWDAATGEQTQAFDHGAALMAMHLAANDEALASAAHDGSTKVWAPSGELLHELSHGSSMYAMTISPDARFVFTGGALGLIKAWDLATGEDSRTFDHGAPVMHLALASDGQTLFSASSDGLVKTWDLATGELDLTLEHGTELAQGHNPMAADHPGVYTLAVSPDLLFSAGSSGLIKAWDLRTGELRHTVDHGKEVVSLALADDDVLFSGGMAGFLRSWDLAALATSDAPDGGSPDQAQAAQTATSLSALVALCTAVAL